MVCWNPRVIRSGALSTPSWQITTTNTFALEVSGVPAKSKPAVNFVFAASRFTVENRDSGSELWTEKLILIFFEKNKFTGEIFQYITEKLNVYEKLEQRNNI